MPFKHGSLVALLVLVVSSGESSPAAANAGNCQDVTVRGVRILDLADDLGCDLGADLASRTVRHDGFLRSGGFYCRWGQGGTRPVNRRGKTFYAGFCFYNETQDEATFLARPSLKTCQGGPDDSYDLRARYLDCRTARRTYRRSLTVAAKHPNRLPLRFRHAGYRWTCRAYNPHHRHSNPAYYEWKCRAPDDVLVHYRLFSGE